MFHFWIVSCFLVMASSQSRPRGFSFPNHCRPKTNYLNCTCNKQNRHSDLNFAGMTSLAYIRIGDCETITLAGSQTSKNYFIETLIIEGSSDVEKVLEFFVSHGVMMTKIELKNIERSFALRREYFQSQLMSLSLFNVTLEKFSTDAFADIDSSSNVTLDNCTIVSVDASRLLSTVDTFQLKIVKFRNVDNENLLIDETFFHLGARNITFNQVEISLFGENVMNVSTTENLQVIDSKFSTFNKEAITGNVHRSLFKGDSFNELQFKSFYAIFPWNETSTIEFRDIYLQGPAIGSLFTQFSEIVFENISTEFCICKHLINLVTHDRLTTPLETEKKLLEKIKNQIFCGRDGTFVNLHDHCAVSDPGNDIVIGSLIAGIVVIIGVACGIYCYFDRKRRQRLEALKKWTFVVPNPDRETLVKFDLDKVQFISRPSSVIFSIDSTVAVTEEAKNLQTPVEMVNGIHMNHAILSPIAEEDEVSNRWSFQQEEQFENAASDDDESENDFDFNHSSVFSRTKTKKYKK